MVNRLVFHFRMQNILEIARKPLWLLTFLAYQIILFLDKNNQLETIYNSNGCKFLACLMLGSKSHRKAGTKRRLDRGADKKKRREH